MSNDTNKTKSDYQERGNVVKGGIGAKEASKRNQEKANNNVTTEASAILSGMEAGFGKAIDTLQDVPKSLASGFAKNVFKPAGAMININSIATAQREDNHCCKLYTR